LVIGEPERYSFSKLSTFHTCKWGYYQRYIKGLTGKGNCYSSYGTLVHSIMERYAKGEFEVWDLANVFDWEFDLSITESFPTKLFGKDYDMRGSYYNDGLNFLSNFKGYSNYKILGVEERFEVPIKDWIFNGVIDLVFEDADGRLIIQDYKSKAKFSSKAEQAEYARQLYLYSLWAKEHYSRYPDLLRFLMFRKGNTVDIPFKIDGLNEAVDWAKDTVHKIRECWDYEATCDLFYSNNLCNHRDYCEMKIEPDLPKYYKGKKCS